MAGDSNPEQRLATFEVDPEACKAYFDSVSQQRARADEMFSQHQMLQVEYERDLVLDYKESMFRINEFLGVIPWIVDPQMAKQQSLTARQQIANFDALQSFFADSPYADFFLNADAPEAVSPAKL